MTTSAKNITPSFQFLLRHPSHFITLGFGTGLSPKAPGTVGTLVGLPLFWLLTFTPESTHFITLAVLFLVGIPLIFKRDRTNLGLNSKGRTRWPR